MKKTALILMVMFFYHINSFSQTNNLAFTYDNAGNIIQRQVFVTARLANPFSNPQKENDSLTVVNFKVFPNPTKDIINIEGKLPDEIDNADVFLFNNIGQILKTDTYSGTTKTIFVNDLKSGIYYLEVKYSKDHSSTYKIIISN